MCGRFVLAGDAGGFVVRFIPGIREDELADLIASGEIIGVLNNYQVRPTQNVPIVTNAGRRRMEVARWGLIPFWWKEPAPPKFATFNARSVLKGCAGWETTRATTRS